MKIDTFFTPFFPEKENQFNGSIVVMIDVLRASTTICSALYNEAKEVIPVETLDKAVQIYSNLSKEIRFLGGERNGVKPAGFDAGNSPLEYSSENVKGKTVILTTSNGTKIFQKARQAHIRIIGSFVNISPVLSYLKSIIEDSVDKNFEIDFLCAGNDGRMSFEDMICAGAFIHALKKSRNDFFLTDSAIASMDLFKLHSGDIKEFLCTREHASLLLRLGFHDDIETALTNNKFPVIPIVTGNSIKKLETDNVNI